MEKEVRLEAEVKTVSVRNMPRKRGTLPMQVGPEHKIMEAP